MQAYKIAGLLLLLVLITTGCGQSVAEKMMEKNLENAMGGDAEVDMDGDNIKIETEEGVSLEVGEGVSLPADFPEDIFVVEGEIVSVMKNVMGAGISVSVLSDKTMTEVKTMYEEKVVEDGWTMTANMSMGEMEMLVATKESRTLNISIGMEEDENKTAVVLNVMELQ